MCYRLQYSINTSVYVAMCKELTLYCLAMVKLITHTIAKNLSSKTFLKHFLKNHLAHLHMALHKSAAMRRYNVFIHKNGKNGVLVGVGTVPIQYSSRPPSSSYISILRSALLSASRCYSLLLYFPLSNPLLART
jgi:hypothetical protein